MEQVLMLKGRVVSSFVVLSAVSNYEQLLFLFLPHVGAPVRKFLQKAVLGFFFCVFPTVLCCSLLPDFGRWRKLKEELRDIFTPVDVDGPHLRKAICLLLFCWWIEKMPLHLAVADFFQVFVLLLFLFFCPSSLAFPFSLMWNESTQMISVVLKYFIVLYTSLRMLSLLTPVLHI